MNNPYAGKPTLEYVDRAEIWEEGRKAGIKEVVEWISEHEAEYLIQDTRGRSITSFTIYKEKWQSKLKEWGVERR